MQLTAEPRTYSSLTVNDVMVLSFIERSGRFPDAHVSQTVRGLAEASSISEMNVWKTLAGLMARDFVTRSDRRILVIGVHNSDARRPCYTYRITPSGVEVLSRLRSDLRW